MDAPLSGRTAALFMKTQPSVSGIVAVLGAALCFGLIPVITINAFTGGLNVLTLLSLRYLLASGVTLAIMRFVFKIRLPEWRLSVKIMAVAGFLMGLQASLYFYALTRMPVATAALLLFTFPIFVYMIERLLGLVKGTFRAFLSLVVCLIGLAWMLGSSAGQVDGLGIICALLAAVAYAAYLVMIDRLNQGIHPAATNALISLGNALVLTATALLSGSFHVQFSLMMIRDVVLLVLVANLIGFYAFYYGLGRLGASLTSALNMTEPLFAVAFSWIILGQRMSGSQIAGGCLVLIGIYVFTLRKKQLKSH
jgi:drug/metabolite transporter (DMT)-like permease